MTEANKAIFLSYAREDAAAARRVAEALRAAGLEVWFDENELRGGDSWDTKIRKQIRECTLFMPVISAQTQARHEGYFRREWKLAVDRMSDMAGGIAFLVPVVVDDTREADALVPEEFMRVQWTRLPGALPTPQFVEQIKRLIVSPRAGIARSAPAAAPTAVAAAGPKRSFPVALAMSLGAVAVAVGAVFFVTIGRKSAVESAPATNAKVAPITTSAAAPATTPAAVSAKSIAVLPFANMSADKDAEFFADGVHEDLLTALAKVRDLKVISRTSVLVYRDASKRNLRQIADELGVAHILEGSVRRAGNKARITVQLIDARTDQHLWAESYDRDVTDIFAVQGEVAREITSALKATLTPDEASLITRRLTANARAYDLFVQARSLEQYIQTYSTREEHERITNLYAAAAEADPGFVLAHVHAAISHGSQYWFASLDPTEQRRAKAFAALDKARALAPDAPEVHLATGAVAYLCRNDWREALAEFRLAEAQLPNDALLFYRMALAHRRLGELAAAESIFQRAAALNPNHVASATTLLETQVSLRRYRDALATFERFRRLIGSDAQSVEFKTYAQFELSGDVAAYLREIAVAPPRANDSFGFNRAYNLAIHQGDLAQADKVLQDPRWETVLGLGGVLGEPKSLHRAQIAQLQGRTADAVRFADEAIAYFEGHTWTERQKPVAKMGIARAKSCAGRHDEAVREAREALVAQEALDQFVLSSMRFWAARVYASAGHADDAMALWRAYAAEPASLPTPRIWALEPFWQRLRGDPRYAEIFQPVRSF